LANCDIIEEIESGGKMRIGVDIDGVLNYRTEIVKEQGMKFCVETGKGKMVNPDAHSLSEEFGWDHTTLDEYWQKYAKYQMMLCPAVAYAAEVIRKLRKEGNEIWIVTGRNEQDLRFEGMPENMGWEDLTRRWLAQNEIEYDAMGFGTIDKADYCERNGIDAMVEDLPLYLEGFDGVTKVLIYDQPYNRQVKVANSERVYAWYDVYNKIKEMEER